MSETTSTTPPAHDPAADAGPGTASRPAPPAALSPAGTSPWVGRGLFVLFALALAVVPSLLGDPTRTRQWAEYLCYAIVAVGLDVAWGYGGMLALGQGVFFGLGAYAMGMHLSLEQVEPGALPQFMTLYSDYDALPLIWRPFTSAPVAWAAAVLVPAAIAAALGWLVFHRRIRGPYFALLTQAMTLIFTLLIIGQLQLTAGTNGLTNFYTVFGLSRYDPATNILLYAAAAVALLLVVALSFQIVRSRFGRLLIAVRDGEDRVRFLGYSPTVVKTIAFAFAAAAAGLAGAISAPVIGIVAPGSFGIVPSILMVTWVAIGGRGTIWGAVLGALVVGWAGTHMSETRPGDWLYLQGLLFVGVVAFVPGGLAALLRSAVTLVRSGGTRRRRVIAPAATETEPAATVVTEEPA